MHFNACLCVLNKTNRNFRIKTIEINPEPLPKLSFEQHIGLIFHSTQPIWFLLLPFAIVWLYLLFWSLLLAIVEFLEPIDFLLFNTSLAQIFAPLFVVFWNSSFPLCLVFQSWLTYYSTRWCPKSLSVPSFNFPLMYCNFFIIFLTSPTVIFRFIPLFLYIFSICEEGMSEPNFPKWEGQKACSQVIHAQHYGPMIRHRHTVWQCCLNYVPDDLPLWYKNVSNLLHGGTCTLSIRQRRISQGISETKLLNLLINQYSIHPSSPHPVKATSQRIEVPSYTSLEVFIVAYSPLPSKSPPINLQTRLICPDSVHIKLSSTKDWR